MSSFCSLFQKEFFVIAQKQSTSFLLNYIFFFTKSKPEAFNNETEFDCFINAVWVKTQKHLWKRCAAEFCMLTILTFCNKWVKLFFFCVCFLAFVVCRIFPSKQKNWFWKFFHIKKWNCKPKIRPGRIYHIWNAAGFQTMMKVALRFWESSAVVNTSIMVNHHLVPSSIMFVR